MRKIERLLVANVSQTREAGCGEAPWAIAAQHYPWCIAVASVSSPIQKHLNPSPAERNQIVSELAERFADPIAIDTAMSARAELVFSSTGRSVARVARAPDPRATR